MMYRRLVSCSSLAAAITLTIIFTTTTMTMVTTVDAFAGMTTPYKSNSNPESLKVNKVQKQQLSPFATTVVTLFMSEAANTETTAESRPDARDVNPAGRYFNLEELEDKEDCTTEVFLNEDLSVTLGETDGPRFINGSGQWKQHSESDGSFEMKLWRTYETGNEKKESTNVGTFTFTVERSYTGEMTYVGANIAVSGIVHNIDETFGDEQVGYFNMIDTTDEKIRYDDDNNSNEPRLKPKPLSTS